MIVNIQQIIRFFGIKRDSLSYSSFILFLGKLFHSVSSLLIFAILSRYFTVEQYGTYRQFLLFGYTLIPLILLGIPNSTNYFIAGEKEKTQRFYVISSILLCLTLTFITGSFFFIFRNEFISLINNRYFSKFIIPMVCMQLFSPLFYLYQPIFVSLRKHRLVVIISVISSFLILLFVVFTISLKLSFDIFIFGFSAIMILNSLGILAKILFESGTKNFFINWGYVKSQVLFSFPLGIALFLGLASKQLDKLLVNFFTNPGTFAIYSNGAFEIPFIALITNSVMAVVLPEYIRLWKNKNVEQITKIWYNSIFKSASIILPVMFFSLMAHKEIIIFIFGKLYISSSIIFFIYLFILPMRVVNFGSILIATGKTNKILKYSFIALLVNVILSIIGFHFLKTPGIAIATVISIYIINIGQLYEISKLLKYPMKQLIPISNLSRIVLACILGLVIVVFISLLNINPIISFIFKGIFFIIIYFFFFYKFIINKIFNP
ncbi:MAG: polysaccharide biosynthesis C-terminal domain-containing protein [Candidatus Cloacimonetes bacterium]|nr:polysaccharide biosynthesis C-terminal domain-containing protein [Candidatus Cloacimonadota bacterium]